METTFEGFKNLDMVLLVISPTVTMTYISSKFSESLLCPSLLCKYFSR